MAPRNFMSLCTRMHRILAPYTRLTCQTIPSSVAVSALSAATGSTFSWSFFWFLTLQPLGWSGYDDTTPAHVHSSHIITTQIGSVNDCWAVHADCQEEGFIEILHVSIFPLVSKPVSYFLWSHCDWHQVNEQWFQRMYRGEKELDKGTSSPLRYVIILKAMYDANSTVEDLKAYRFLVNWVQISWYLRGLGAILL